MLVYTHEILHGPPWEGGEGGREVESGREGGRGREGGGEGRGRGRKGERRR